MRVAIYARVSTSDQNNALQIGELENYVKARGWTHTHTAEDQISGAKAKRPGLQFILECAQQRQIDVVLVWKLDRFGRSVQDLLANLQALESAGVRFIAVTQGIDTDQSNPVSRLILQVLAAIAEFERELIRERTSAGVEKYKRDLAAGKAKSKSGKNLPPHRPKKIFDRSQVVLLRSEGMSFRMIADRLSIGLGTVTRTYNERSKSCADSGEKPRANTTQKRTTISGG
jgi:putative DNA-invertase from lambdoid prophage Rac